MVVTTSAEKGLPSISYEELSDLTIDAVIELEQLELGQLKEAKAVEHLADSLGLTGGKVFSSPEALSRLVDPRTVDLYTRTVSHLTDASVGSIDDLIAQIRKYADAFHAEGSALGAKQYSNMRSFCLALHRELLAETCDNRIDGSIEAT